MVFSNVIEEFKELKAGHWKLIKRCPFISSDFLYEIYIDYLDYIISSITDEIFNNIKPKVVISNAEISTDNRFNRFNQFRPCLVLELDSDSYYLALDFLNREKKFVEEWPSAKIYANNLLKKFNSVFKKIRPFNQSYEVDTQIVDIMITNFKANLSLIDDNREYNRATFLNADLILENKKFNMPELTLGVTSQKSTRYISFSDMNLPVPEFVIY